MTNESGAGAVAIGRNEGKRLERCMESLRGRFDPIVYVDSGSMDESVEFVRGLGLDVVELDMSIPFTAGRARNAGFDRIMQIRPDTAFVQFIDGDCELISTWPEQAQEVLQANPDHAIVCGRRRERAPGASIYNRLCDLEWDSATGLVRSCGGDFLVRSEAFEVVAGFDPGFVAGEEPELCLRLRQRGWCVERLAAEMTLHDAAMDRVGQWWLRAQRAGHAYAQTAWKHFSTRDPQIFNPVRSMVLWAAVFPLVSIAAVVPSGGWSLCLLALYPVQVARVFREQRLRARSTRDSLAYALSVVAAKFAQLHGMLRFMRDRILNRPATLIEYKGPGVSSGRRP